MKYKNINKLIDTPIKNIDTKRNVFLKKPEWIKIKFPINFSRIQKIKEIIKKNHLRSVCEEAACPNIIECFNNGTATFMILGEICTRRCPFCNVSHGRPRMPDLNEPHRLAQTVIDMKLKYVVITSVNRDDLHDGGAQQFANCISILRNKNSKIKIEILTPDFRGCVDLALKIFSANPPDVFNHNLESVPRLYHKVRPGASYHRSLRLLEHFKKDNPNIPTKSGLMMGLGETKYEIIKVMRDMYCHGVTMLTLGQYLQPSDYHLPVQRYVDPSEFDEIKERALKIGFTHVACGPLVRSSYYAEYQAKSEIA